jgi:hypothetical protein
MDCGIQITIFVGLLHPLIGPLAEFSRLPLDPSDLSDLCRTHFLTLLWMLHKAIRRLFFQHTTVSLECIVADHESGIHYSRETLLSQMRPSPIVSDDLSAGHRSVASDLTGPSYGYSVQRSKNQQETETRVRYKSLSFRPNLTT